MEIERKWLVNGWPENLPLIREQFMEQGYLSVRPTVRIRREALSGGDTEYVLCLKTGTGIARKEIEMAVEKQKYDEICDMIGLPLIPKLRRTYGLPDGLSLEVNHVDEGLPTEFWYAEIEFETIEQAENWRAPDDSLAQYLSEDVTEDPGQSMGAYWLLTRRGQTEDEK